MQMDKKKILVADDDPDILDVVGMVLEAQDYEVIFASDGVECLGKLRAEKPHLMILDLLMPKMDGFAVYRELQLPSWSDYRDVPIIILSSVREEASRRRYELETGKKLSPDEYMEKPVMPDVLLSRVEKVLKRKQQV